MASMHPTRRHTVVPQNTIRLMEAVGATRAAAKLGVSTTLLHKARKDGVINQVVDIAAAHALEHLTDVPVRLVEHRRKPDPKPDAMFLLSVSADKAPLVEQFAKTLHAELVSA